MGKSLQVRKDSETGGIAFFVVNGEERQLTPYNYHESLITYHNTSYIALNNPYNFGKPGITVLKEVAATTRDDQILTIG